MFYRKLKTPNNISNHEDLPSVEQVAQYWSTIWSIPQEHDRNASWINVERRKYEECPDMTFHEVTTQDVKEALTRTQNWKSPGPDRLTNFWYKRFTSLHPKIAELFTEAMRTPNMIPSFLTQGITYLLPKNGSFNADPSKGRPITCLSTLYKLFTSCINTAIYSHLDTNNILAEEQKGCIKKSRGCKEQLTIDSVILGQAVHRKRNLYTGYIDYKKAFDSLPHSWLTEVLHIYRINDNVINCLTHLMKSWRTKIQIRHGEKILQTREINISNGIFQGDCLSALWFCMAINPLSSMLNTTNYGFDIKGNGNENKYKINHLLYMDDLKIYASTRNHLDELLRMVERFTTNIKMSFGLDKCRTLHIVRGKTAIPTQETNVCAIKQMDEDDLYKYLGMMQGRRTEDKQIRKDLQTEFKSRLHRILKAKLNGKHLIKAINTFAIPILTYSFGIIKWSTTDLHELQRKIRTMMTKYGVHHPKSCCERMTVPRNRGGRGLIDIAALHDKQIVSLRQFFHQKQLCSRLHRAVVQADDTLTPLHLQEDYNPLNIKSIAELEQTWAQKALHGRYYHSLHSNDVDFHASNKWLLNADIFAETEGFLTAIQDEILPTRNYQKYIMKDPNARVDNCRRCGAIGETIDHIISACPVLAQTDYLKRHNDVAKIVHHEICKIYNIPVPPVPYYQYHPDPVLDNNEVIIYYDRTIHTNSTREHNRPDITIIEKANKVAKFIDIAVPLSRNMTRTHNEKLSKYAELAVEVKTQWRLQKVDIIPLIASSTGLIHTRFNENLKQLKILKNITDRIQKSIILNTCHTVRKFLQ